MGIKCAKCEHVMTGKPVMRDHEKWMECFPVYDEIMIDPLMSAMRKTDNWIARRIAYLSDGLKKAKAKLSRTRSADRKKQLQGAVDSWEHRIENDPIDVTMSEQAFKLVSISCPKCGSAMHSFVERN